MVKFPSIIKQGLLSLPQGDFYQKKTNKLFSAADWSPNLGDKLLVRIPNTSWRGSHLLSLCLILRTTAEWKCWQCDTGWWGAGSQQLNNDEIDVWQPLTGECQPICLSVSTERWMTLQPQRRWKYSQCCHVTISLSSSLTLMLVPSRLHNLFRLSLMFAVVLTSLWASGIQWIVIHHVGMGDVVT